MLILLHNFTQYVLLHPFTFKYISLTLSSAFLFYSIFYLCLPIWYLCSFYFLISFLIMSFYFFTPKFLSFVSFYLFSFNYILCQCLTLSIFPLFLPLSYVMWSTHLWNAEVKTFPVKKGFPLPPSNFTAWDPITYLPIHA